MKAEKVQDVGEGTPTKEKPETPARAGVFSRQALARILELDLEPTPQVYELWFRYFQGDPEIVRAVDTQKPVDENDCHRIYSLYLSESARSDALKTIGGSIQKGLNDLVETLASVQSMTTEYGGSLNGVADRIKNATSLEELGNVVSVIVSDTRRVLQQNQTLESQLNNSSNQMAELRRSLDAVKREALTDGLTGLANRKAFDNAIHDKITEAGLSGADLCLVMMDVDFFKSFNDNYGHQTGDQVLRLVSRTLLDGIKGRDLAARYGGEEFAILLPDTSLSSAIKLADALRVAVESKEVINKSTNKSLGRITLSGGVSCYKRGESITSFIERADAALYEAKERGRNNIRASNR